MFAESQADLLKRRLTLTLRPRSGERVRFTVRTARGGSRIKPGETARRFEVLATRPMWQRQLAEAVAGGEFARRVWAAVLLDAITALRWRHPEGHIHGRQRGTASPEALWREAAAWVMSRDAEPLGTFESVCLVLDLAVADVRRDLCALAAAHAPVIGRKICITKAPGLNDAEVAA